MSQMCPIRSRACTFRFPSQAPEGPDAIGPLPPRDKQQELTPYIGTLIDMAQEFDRCGVDGELGTAVEFVHWLQVTIGDVMGSPARISPSEVALERRSA